MIQAPSVGAAPFDAKAAVSYGLFVKEAYAMQQASPGKLTPPPTASFPSGYRLSSWITMQDFVFESTEPQFYGFIAQDKQNPASFVLAIRGTTSAIEWWDDLNALIPVPFKVFGFGNVGDGFAKIYNTLHVIENPPSAEAGPARSLHAVGGFAAQVGDLLARHAPETGGGTAAAPRPATIEVMGHSLGAALTTLYIADNATQANVRTTSLCTFASPRVGDSTFVSAFDGLGITSWRVALSTDVVTDLPPDALGFRHVAALTMLRLPWDTRWFWPPCSHALLTYLHLLDASQPASSECSLTFAAQRVAKAAATAGGATAAVAASPQAAQPVVQITVHTAGAVSQG